jgi:glyoxylase I family protein
LILGHIAVSVSDISRSAKFYGKYFGLKCIRKYVYKEAGFTIAILKKGSIALELFEFKKHKLLPKYRRVLDTDLRTIGVKHFSVEVRDIEGLYEKFKKAGLSLATGLRVLNDGSKYFFIRDPDGILVELMQAAKFKRMVPNG